MSEQPITPFPAPAGLTTLGADDAGVCVDGVCYVPKASAGDTADDCSIRSTADPN